MQPNTTVIYVNHPALVSERRGPDVADLTSEILEQARTKQREEDVPDEKANVRG